MAFTAIIAFAVAMAMNSISRPSGDDLVEKATGNRTMTCGHCLEKPMIETATEDCSKDKKNFTLVSVVSNRITYKCGE